MVVLPDSVLPLAFRDSAGPPMTTYPCLDSLNTTHGFLNLYKAYPHRDFHLDGTFIVVFPDTADIDSLAASYLASGCVVSAGKVMTIQYDKLPNDSLFLNTAGNPGERQWALDGYHSRVDQAWDITTGDSNLVIAVVDDGVFWEHPDLINSMWINAAEDLNDNGTFECWSSTEERNGVSGDLDSVDNDNNDYIDDVVGIKATPEGFTPDVRMFRHDYTPGIDSTLDSASYHGTFVASIIAGRTNNGSGTAGAAGGWGDQKGIRIMAAVPGNGGFPHFFNAVKYAIDNGANIINMSWGVRLADALWKVPQLRQLDSLLAIAYFERNIVCVAAAGNNSSKVAFYPAAFGEDEFYPNYPAELLSDGRVLGIGSLDSLNLRCANSNYGDSLYDFSAPGWNWGAFVDGTPTSITYGYGWSNCGSAGCATSWATPLASAVAGLVWSAFPYLPNSQVYAKMHAGVSPTDTTFHWGPIDAFRPMVTWPRPNWKDTISLYGDVVVPVGGTLTVQAGANIFMPGGDYANQGTNSTKVEIIVNGTLIARGTDSLPITFRADPSGGYDKWAGIRVQDGGSAILDHVIIENAICGIEIDSADVCSLRAVTINQCQSFGIDVASQNVSIRHSRVSDIQDGYGIRANSGAQVSLYGDTIRNAYGGIEFFATRPSTLLRSVIETCQVHGVYTESDSLAISWTTIHDITEGTGIVGVGATADLYRCYVYRCPVGMSLDMNSGGEVRSSRFGDGVEATGTVGLSVDGPVYVWQTLIDGPFTSAGLKVGVEDPLIYECKIDGHGTGHYGLWATLYSSPKVRCTQVVGQSARGIYGYKAYMDLGKNQAGEYGNNTFDTVAAYAIESVVRSVMAERNFFSKYCTPTPPPDSCAYDTCPPWVQFLGSVDYNPWLRCWPDSCGFARWDTTPPPGGGGAKLVVQEPQSEGTADLNYPNPFNPSTVIRYTLHQSARVEVSVFNVIGQRVRVLADQIQTAGVHEVSWDGRDDGGRPVASGVYFYHIQAGAEKLSRKMVLLR